MKRNKRKSLEKAKAGFSVVCFCHFKALSFMNVCDSFLLEIHCAKEIGTVEIGFRKVDGEERKEVRMWQAVATLVDISFHFQAVERRERVTIVGCGGHSQTELPCAFALYISKRLASHRGPTVDLVEHRLRSTLAIVALCSETDEQLACCIALEVVVSAVGYGREEQLAA